MDEEKDGIKRYDVDPESKKIIDKVINYETLRGLYVKVPFGFKKAVKCGELHRKYKSIFWDRITKLYPELKYKEAHYEGASGKVREGLAK